MRNTLTLAFLLLALPGIAQSFTLDELLKLRTMRPRQAATLLKSRGWKCVESVRGAVPVEHRKEEWVRQPDTLVSQNLSRIIRVRIRPKINVLYLKLAPCELGNSIDERLYNGNEAKRRGEGSGIAPDGTTRRDDFFYLNKIAFDVHKKFDSNVLCLKSLYTIRPLIFYRKQSEAIDRVLGEKQWTWGN